MAELPNKCSQLSDKDTSFLSLSMFLIKISNSNLNENRLPPNERIQFCLLQRSLLVAREQQCFEVSA